MNFLATISSYTIPLHGLRVCALLLLFAILFSNCLDGSIQVPTKDEFTKDKREAFGEMVVENIASNYNLLPNQAPYDSIYWYTQTLYSQASSIMHLDKQSPIENRWDPEREWRVSIIDDDESVHAFAVPGGDLFVSTGMLKSFKREHEFFFLLTFEAAIMNEGILLNRLIEEYNSLTINNLIEGRATGNEVTLDDVTTAIPLLTYEENSIESVDEETVASICKTSILEPTGINTVLLDGNFQNTDWLKTRPSYGNRPSNILDLSNRTGADCGGSTGNGNYQRFVLNILN